MKEQVSKSVITESKQPKSEKQASVDTILSEYGNSIQRKAIGGEEPLQKKANNTGLPDNLKSGIENLSGYAMDDVKVHYNSSEPAGMQAHAYAQGTDIHIGPGQEKHLPHEAWHVVQQKQGRVRPTMQMKGKVNINDDTGLETEADIMGKKSLTAGMNNSPVSFKSINDTTIVQRNRIISHNAEANTSPVTTIVNFIANQTGFDVDNVKKAMVKKKVLTSKYFDVLNSSDANYKPVSVKAYVDSVTGSKGRAGSDMQTAIGKLGYIEDALRGRESPEYDGGHLLGYGWYKDWDLINTAKNVAPQDRSENRSIYGFEGGWGESESEFREISDEVPTVVTAYVNYAGGTYTVSLHQLAECLLDDQSDVYKEISKMYTARLRFVVVNSRVPKQYVIEHSSINPVSNNPLVNYDNVKGPLPTAWIPSRIPRALLAPIEDAVLRNALPFWESLGSLGKFGGATVSKNQKFYIADMLSDVMKLAQFGINYLVYAYGYSYVAAASTILYYFGNGTFSSIIQAATINNINLFTNKQHEFIGNIDSVITTAEKLVTVDKLLDYAKSSTAYLASAAFNFSEGKVNKALKAKQS
jgi:hypothetical protein